MPLPKTKKVGKVIKKLKKEKPSMSKKQKVAIALSVARKAGADIPKKKGNPSKKSSVKKTVKMVKKHLKEDIKMFQHEAAEDKKLIKKLKK